MGTKVCTKCNVEKDIDLFVTKKKSIDGHASECKECHNTYNRNQYIDNIDLSRERGRINAKNSYDRNPEKNRKNASDWAKNNPQKAKKTKDEYKKKNPDKVKAWKKADRIRRRDKIKEHSKLYYQNNKKKINEKSKIRRNSSEQNKLKHNLTNRIRIVLKGLRKGGHLHELTGCSIDFLKAHLESQFKDGITWANYGKGGWDVDHIIPCNAFDLTDINQQLACFNWRNLQPLWSKPNIAKGGRYKQEDFDAYLILFTELNNK